MIVAREPESHVRMCRTAAAEVAVVEWKLVKPKHLPNDVFDWIIGEDEPEAAMLLAHDTAWALLDRVRANPAIVDRVLAHAREGGIDDIATLWSRAHETTLAGVLWRLYLLRKAVASDPEMNTHIFQRGMESARTIDPIIVGVAEPISVETVAQLCDAILTGVFVGDFGAALDRAWAYSRVMSHGSASLADDRDSVDDEHAEALTRRAYRYTQIAESLQRAAARWRSGTLD